MSTFSSVNATERSNKITTKNAHRIWPPETHTNSSVTRQDVVGILMQVDMTVWIQERKNNH